jgi:hypothetical protein
MQYSFGKTITTDGITGEYFNALHNPTASPINVSITPYRNQKNNAITIRINAGETIEVKVSQVKPGSNIIGFS